MHKQKTIKFIRFEDNKVIILPSKPGIALIKQYLTDRGVKIEEAKEKIGNQELFALHIVMDSDVKYLKVTQTVTSNNINIHATSVNMQIVNFSIPLAVEEEALKVEESKPDDNKPTT